MTERWAIVGCGSQKLDLSGDKGPVAISRLYTSNYFELKREYAKECCDKYRILSAKYGLVGPGFYVEDDYDLTVTDFDDDQLDEWVAGVSSELQRIAEYHPDYTLVLLAGQDYLDPLEDALSYLPNEIERPFDDTSGIGEQMGWLKEQIETADEELFHIVHHDHGAEATETIEQQDVEVVRREMVSRGESSDGEHTSAHASKDCPRCGEELEPRAMDMGVGDGKEAGSAGGTVWLCKNRDCRGVPKDERPI